MSTTDELLTPTTVTEGLSPYVGARSGGWDQPKRPPSPFSWDDSCTFAYFPSSPQPPHVFPRDVSVSTASTTDVIPIFSRDTSLSAASTPAGGESPSPFHNSALTPPHFLHPHSQSNSVASPLTATPSHTPPRSNCDWEGTPSPRSDSVSCSPLVGAREEPGGPHPDQKEKNDKNEKAVQNRPGRRFSFDDDEDDEDSESIAGCSLSLSLSSVLEEKLSPWMSMEFGIPGSLTWRLFLLNDNCQLASAWHHVPLHASGAALNFICATPADSWVRYEIAQEEEFTPLRVRKRWQCGAPSHYAENAEGFNVGILPQTWLDPQEQVDAGKKLGSFSMDGRPVEAVDITARQAQCGDVYRVKPVGAFAVVADDRRSLSWKVLVVAVDDALADVVCDVEDVRRRRPELLERVKDWLTICSCMEPDDDENVMAMDGKPVGADEALVRVAQAHCAWQLLADDVQPCSPWSGPRDETITPLFLQRWWKEQVGPAATAAAAAFPAVPLAERRFGFSLRSGSVDRAWGSAREPKPPNLSRSATTGSAVGTAHQAWEGGSGSSSDRWLMSHDGAPTSSPVRARDKRDGRSGSHSAAPDLSADELKERLQERRVVREGTSSARSASAMDGGMVQERGAGQRGDGEGIYCEDEEEDEDDLQLPPGCGLHLLRQAPGARQHLLALAGVGHSHAGVPSSSLGRGLGKKEQVAAALKAAAAAAAPADGDKDSSHRSRHPFRHSRLHLSSSAVKSDQQHHRQQQDRKKPAAAAAAAPGGSGVALFSGPAGVPRPRASSLVRQHTWTASTESVADSTMRAAAVSAQALQQQQQQQQQHAMHPLWGGHEKSNTAHAAPRKPPAARRGRATSEAPPLSALARQGSLDRASGFLLRQQQQQQQRRQQHHQQALAGFGDGTNRVGAAVPVSSVQRRGVEAGCGATARAPCGDVFRTGSESAEAIETHCAAAPPRQEASTMEPVGFVGRDGGGSSSRSPLQLPLQHGASAAGAAAATGVSGGAGCTTPTSVDSTVDHFSPKTSLSDVWDHSSAAATAVASGASVSVAAAAAASVSAASLALTSSGPASKLSTAAPPHWHRSVAGEGCSGRRCTTSSESQRRCIAQLAVYPPQQLQWLSVRGLGDGHEQRFQCRWEGRLCARMPAI